MDGLLNQDGDENKDIVLTDEQKGIIVVEMEKNPEKPPTVKELISLVFNKPIEQCDARRPEGIAIRQYIREIGLKFRNAREWIPDRVIVLTEEQKVFITNNCSAMMPLEIARTLFNNQKLTNLDLETRAIQKYIKELPENAKLLPTKKTDEINIEDYQPPKTEEQTIKRINRYVTSADYNKEKLSEKQKKEVKKLMQYLYIHRFLVTINEFETIKERDLFESEYVRGTYNKSDLTQEQLDQYIMYSSAVVDEKTLEKTIKELRAIEQQTLSENRNINQPLAERLNDLSGKKEACIKRQNDILKSLEGERKTRLLNNSQVKETVADVLAYFQNEEKRRHLLNLALERREKLKEEINRIKNMTDVRAEMFGVTEKEILD